MMFEISIVSAFLAGILAFISPCIFPLIPVYISFMSSKAIFKEKTLKLSDRLYILLNSIFFVLGFTIVFVILGSTATFFGQLLNQYATIISRVGGGILIVFGLHYLGLFKIPFLNYEKKFKIPEKLKTGFLSSFLIGVIFSFGWIPCVGMILTSILLFASQLDTLLQGILLLLTFSLGLGLPFILSALFLSLFSRFFSRITKHLRIVSIIAGIFLIVLGIIFITDSMFRLIGFFGRFFPILDTLAL